MISDELKEKVEGVPAIRRSGLRPGYCDRCKDFSNLTKSIFNDPYTGQDSFGWMCGDCIKQTAPIQAKYNYTGGRGRISTDLSKHYFPVPKPPKKVKKRFGS